MDSEDVTNKTEDASPFLHQAVDPLVTIFDRGLTDGDTETHRLVSGALNNLYAALRRVDPSFK